jgi:hypothetical protein
MHSSIPWCGRARTIEVADAFSKSVGKLPVVKDHEMATLHAFGRSVELLDASS